MSTQGEYDAAVLRAKRKRERVSPMKSVYYSARRNRLIIRLLNGMEVSFAPDMVPEFEAAKPSDFERLEISPSGYGLHVPALDTDLDVPLLLQQISAFKKRFSVKSLGTDGRVNGLRALSSRRKQVAT